MRYFLPFIIGYCNGAIATVYAVRKKHRMRQNPMRYPVIITAALSLAACVADVDNVDSQPSDKNDAVVESDKQMNERAKQASKLIETALAGTQGYDITESLTTEVGQRLAGTEAEARARDWAVQKFKDIGLENVRVEPFTIPGWERGDESAYIISPYPQKLEITTLGYSVATPSNGVEAEVVYFSELDALQATTEDLTGKIAFIDGRMAKAPDGATYGPAGMKRRIGASEARHWDFCRCGSSHYRIWLAAKKNDSCCCLRGRGDRSSWWVCIQR